MPNDRDPLTYIDAASMVLIELLEDASKLAFTCHMLATHMSQLDHTQRRQLGDIAPKLCDALIRLEANYTRNMVHAGVMEK